MAQNEGGNLVDTRVFKNDYNIIFILYFNAEKDTQKKKQKKENFLNFSGNESTMNLNPLILANVQGSSYFKGTNL